MRVRDYGAKKHIRSRPDRGDIETVLDFKKVIPSEPD